MQNWTKEIQVDEFVREKLKALHLEFGKDFKEKDSSPNLKEALKGAAKTEEKTGTAIPDFIVEKYTINNQIFPIIIENKLGLNKLKITKDIFSDNAIKNYAVNGALHYCLHIIQSYKQAIAIGVAGDNAENTTMEVYFVSDDLEEKFIKLPNTDFNFLENQKSFKSFIDNITLSDDKRQKLLKESLEALSKEARALNKLMHSCNITAAQRVLYVSGMLLSMQAYGDGLDTNEGLTPQDLASTQDFRDGQKIIERIKEFLEYKQIPQQKLTLMLESFKEISKDTDRDKPQSLDNKDKKAVAKLLSLPQASINKQIFTFIYERIFKQIEKYNSHLDFIGELYSEFLKYALGDGKELGIVLTPPYVTKMMSELLEITHENRVMDLATGSAGFLISAMQKMVDSANAKFTKNSKNAKEAIRKLKKEQLLGVEFNAEMFTLATTNMILRGDGSSKIYKGDSFKNILESTIKEFKADRLLLNPPFTYEGNGMPFIKHGLDRMPPHALGAIIIQDSAGNGGGKPPALPTNLSLLKKHTLLASIKMPSDLFQPIAGVQTSIYIFKAGIPHDFDKPVKFIDFRNDGYKRTKRSLIEIDNPKQRYKDIIKIYKAGLNAKVDNSAYKEPIILDKIFVEDFIDESGKDWNFDQHSKTDTTPRYEDFKKCVSEYLAWEVSQVLKNGLENQKDSL